jgi:hypothetical protein
MREKRNGMSKRRNVGEKKDTDNYWHGSRLPPSVDEVMRGAVWAVTFGSPNHPGVVTARFEPRSQFQPLKVMSPTRYEVFLSDYETFRMRLRLYIERETGLHSSAGFDCVCLFLHAR